jgi:hypothetical protein
MREFELNCLKEISAIFNENYKGIVEKWVDLLNEEGIIKAEG